MASATAPTLGMAIPCYKPHIPKLLRLLDCIEKQTRKPDAVLVSCSSMPESEPRPAFPEYSFEFKIVYHVGKMNASMNRNFAASQLATDYVSFFDADDIMHPQRLEAISMAIAGGADFIVHSYSKTPLQTEPALFSDISVLYDTLIKTEPNPYGFHQLGGIRGCRVHHGQPTVHRSILEKIQFPIELQYGEDSIFCTNGLPHSTKNAYIHLPLSIYLPSGSWSR
jgi:hypothetical protein